MKNKMNLVLFSLALFVSCENSDLNQTIDLIDSNVENTRIVFKSSNEFYSTFDSLARMGYEEQTVWIDSLKIKDPLCSNLDFCDDSVMVDMPRSFQALFNKDLEIQINDSVVYFKQGDMYVKEINRIALAEPVLFSSVDVNNKQCISTKAGYDTPNNNLGASYQYEFFIGDTKFKYVHELKCVSITLAQPNGSRFWHQRLFLVVKLEWRGRKGWNVAGEPRDIYINLNMRQCNLFNVKNNQEILLQARDNMMMLGDSYYADIIGFVGQVVIGYPSTGKANDWAPSMVSASSWVNMTP